MSISIANNNISSSGTLTLNNKSLANVAFSGEYGDLKNKPDIGSGGLLTKSWNDGDGNWYRVYDDGFIEQGGKYQAPGNSVRAKVTLPLQFSSTNYSVQMAVYAELGTSTYWGPTNGVGAIIHKTASTFEAGNAYSATIYNKPTYIEWYTYGY